MLKEKTITAEQKEVVPQKQNEWISQSNTQKTSKLHKIVKIKPILEVKPSDIEYITFDTDWDGLKERLSEEFDVVIVND